MPIYKIIDPVFVEIVDPGDSVDSGEGDEGAATVTGDRADCTVTVCLADDGVTELWRAWTPTEIDIATVLNIDAYPTIIDERSDTDTTEISFRVPTVAEAKRLYPAQRDDHTGEVIVSAEDQHRVIATYAAVLKVVSVAEAAAACDVPEQSLVDEALGWAAASAPPAAAPTARRGSRSG